MAIGEFGGAPASGGPVLSNGLYWLYEVSHAALHPARAFADVTRLYFKNPLNPFAHTTYGKSVAAAAELFERSTRRYGKPEWRIDSVVVGGER
ncbi:MAG: polyhydroxyalkanoate depolymerase, partial [Xanthobacteraceae bacterium]